MFRIECNERRKAHVRTPVDAREFMKAMIVSRIQDDHVQFCYTACNHNGLPTVTFHTPTGMEQWSTLPITNMDREEEKV